MCMCNLSHFSHVLLIVILWNVIYQTPLSIGFTRKEYWSGLPWPPPKDLPDPGIKPLSPAAPAWKVDFLTTEWPGKPVCVCGQEVSTHSYFFTNLLHKLMQDSWFMLGFEKHILLCLRQYHISWADLFVFSRLSHFHFIFFSTISGITE